MLRNEKKNIDLFCFTLRYKNRNRISFLTVLLLKKYIYNNYFLITNISIISIEYILYDAWNECLNS